MADTISLFFFLWILLTPIAVFGIAVLLNYFADCSQRKYYKKINDIQNMIKNIKKMISALKKRKIRIYSMERKLKKLEHKEDDFLNTVMYKGKREFYDYELDDIEKTYESVEKIHKKYYSLYLQNAYEDFLMKF